jgi:hypothetical protein
VGDQVERRRADQDADEQVARDFGDPRQLGKVPGQERGHQNQPDRQDLVHGGVGIAAKNRFPS